MIKQRITDNGAEEKEKEKLLDIVHRCREWTTATRNVVQKEGVQRLY
jgi:hypothetical protein